MAPSLAEPSEASFACMLVSDAPLGVEADALRAVARPVALVELALLRVALVASRTRRRKHYLC